MRKLSRLACLGIFVPLVFALWQPARSEAPRPPKLHLDDLLRNKRSLPGLNDGPLSEHADDTKPLVRVGLTPSTAKTGDIVTLSVTVSLAPDAYTYSTTDTTGATTIDIQDAAGLKPVGDFEADRRPTLAKEEATGRPLEKFERGVTWLRQYKVTGEPKTAHIRGAIDLKYCSPSGCRTFAQPIRAALVDSGSSGGSASRDSKAPASKAPGGTLTQEVTPMSRGGQSGHARLRFSMSPADAKPNDLVTLKVAMELDPGWHTYSTTQKEEIGSTPTTIGLTGGKALQPIGDAFRPDRAPESYSVPGDELGPKEIFQGTVTWSRHFKYAPKAGEQGFAITGTIRYGVCNESNCLPPKSVDFKLGEATGIGPLPPSAPDNAQPETVNAPLAFADLAFYLGTAFLGGLLLNVMPCVLPVLAIKVLSFVQQAGESRSRIFFLNVAYAIGVMVVFLALATLAVVTRASLRSAGGFSWGSLFADTRFNLVMACLVFAMGLSLLGVFEIPVPGMIGSAAGRHQREGLFGAFLTGIFATLLATPCLGPFMGTAIFWSIHQPVAISYMVFAMMAVGMAAPYLLLGLFPKFVRWLPKPGNWMIRLKEFAGFVLLGSVIFIVSYTDKRFTVPLLVMLLGVSLGLWMIGNLYDFNSHIRHKMSVRVSAIVLTALICWLGYGLAAESKYRLPWQPFSDAKIASLLKEKKTVLVDFTADWCANCHWNEYFALDTKETQQFVKKHGIVPLVADFTKQPPELKRWLERFKQEGVPLTVIFPAGREKAPIVLESVYTKGKLLRILEEAVAAPASSDARADALSASIR